MIVIKKVIPMPAFQLGTPCARAQKLMNAQLLLPLPEGLWEVRTREAALQGEIAKTGDYIKLDSIGMPYPVEKEWFEANHRHLRDEEYEQIPKPLRFWQEGDLLWEEVAFLLVFDKITLDPEHQDRYYNAVLWGAPLSAPRDAVIVVYGVDRDEQGHIRDVDFNFVDREVFERDYTILGE